MSLEQRNFIVTGGSSGIGKAIANLLNEKGANVTITGRNLEKLEKTAISLGVDFIHADVSKEEDIELTFDRYLQKHDTLDGLINNAGIGRRLNLNEVTLKDFHDIYGVNVFGAALMAQKASEIFKRQGYGDLINIGSTSSLKGYEGGTIYAGTKFALKCMTQCWQAELRKYNIRVMLINPSEVTTAFAVPDRIEREEEANKLRPIEIAHAVVAALEMDRRGFIPELNVFATNPF